jgi:hypothetical protein
MTCATCLSPSLSGTAGNDFVIFFEPSDFLKTLEYFINIFPLEILWFVMKHELVFEKNPQSNIIIGY